MVEMEANSASDTFEGRKIVKDKIVRFRFREGAPTPEFAPPAIPAQATPQTQVRGPAQAGLVGQRVLVIRVNFGRHVLPLCNGLI